MSVKISKTKKAKINRLLHSELERLRAELAADEGDIKEIRSTWQERDSPSEDLLRELEWSQYESIQERARLAELAKEKLETGKYGICEKCGSEIVKQRLKAVPFARFCITCQSETESVSEHNKHMSYFRIPEIY